MWTTTIVYTDDSLRWQRRLVRRAVHELVLDATGLKYLCDSNRFQEVGGLLGAVPPGLVFLGSSSFHHLSYHLVKRCASRPLGIVVFDRHDDLLPTLPGHVSCSSWLREVVKLPTVSRVLVIGSGDDPAHQPEAGADDDAATCAARAAERAVRAAAYAGPGAAERAARVATCAAHLGADLMDREGATSLGKVKWARSGRLLEELARFCAPLAAGSSPPRLYVSIDKDVLAEAETDWGSGELCLGRLLELLAWLRQHALVVGADVSGELVPRGPWPTVTELAQIRKNEEVNLALARTLTGSRTVRRRLAVTGHQRPRRPAPTRSDARLGVTVARTN